MMFVFLVIVAILAISAIITAAVVFLVNRNSNRDYYDEAEFGKTKTFDPNVFLNDDGSEEELSMLDTYEVDNGENNVNDIRNKFDSDSSSKEDLLELEKTSHDLKLDFSSYLDGNEEEELI